MTRMTGPRTNRSVAATTSAPGRGFSLVEMLTVLVILAIVLSILLPALAATRNSARKAATQTIQKTIGDACQQFAIDQRRQPGYFNQTQMGSNQNLTFGFTQMQNLVLDLAGGVTNRTTEDVANRIIDVGPTPQARAIVAIDEIGSPTLSNRGNVSKAYFRPDPKYFVAQTGPNQLAMNDANDTLFPMIVDPWNQPMLAWVQDEVPTGSELFSADEAGTGANAVRAKFYWTTNAGVLRAQSTGRSGSNQNIGSLLGGQSSLPVNIGSFSVSARAASLAGLLGNPSGGFVTGGPATGPKMPLVARGSVIIQSAGPN
ncbi:MAG: prepilin-type N-terminal cleavage/methylation domain-containing protein, partial [Phycisphaerales bacterium]|nr:prepilin-type N-terminal cleavage/methylation domain-containing protein [Phycisphaerales bacterium]